MTQTTQTIDPSSFDYGNLPANVVEAAEAVVPRIRDRFKTLTLQQLDNGNDLLETRERLGKSLFRVWLDRYFDGSEYLARNLMKAATLVKRMPHLIELMLGWSTAALAALSAGSDRLVEKILTRGDRLSASTVKQRVRQERTGEVPQTDKNKKRSPQQFTQEEVDRKIAAALAEKEREWERARIESEREIQQRIQEEYRKARDAALLAAKAEIEAAQQVREELHAKNAELVAQLQEKEAEISAIAELPEENQALEQRIGELERALERSKQESWEKTFNEEAAKVVNEDLEKVYQPLVEKLERMTQVVAQQEEELQRYRQLSDEKEEQRVSEETLAIASDFGQLAETLELPGWSGRGYRASDGMLYTNLVSAIAHFIQDFQPGSSRL